MVVKLLGGFDVFVGVVFFIYGIFISAFGIHILPGFLLIFLGLVLLVKGLIFVAGLDIASIIDVVIGFVIIFSPTYDMPFFIYAIVAIFLIQKGVFSLLN